MTEFDDTHRITSQPIDLPNPWNLNTVEATQGNLLVVGQTGSGKTRLAAGIADTLMKIGFDVVVFDPTGVWRKVSSVPHYMKLYEGKANIMKVISPGIIYDMSNLYIDSQKKLVNEFCRWIWESRVNEARLRPLMIVLEEAQLYTRNVRSEVAQQLFRIAMAGRNLKVRLCLISPRLNNIDAMFVFLSTQRWIGTGNEENVSRKIKAMYGKKIAEICKTLKVGEFVYASRSDSPIWLRVPCFETERRPRPISGKTRGIAYGPGISDAEDLENIQLGSSSMGIPALLILLFIMIFIYYTIL